MDICAIDPFRITFAPTEYYYGWVSMTDDAGLAHIIASKVWVLERPNGDVRSDFVTFDQGGQLHGYMHQNESAWAIRDGRLVFLSRTGVVTSASEPIDASIEDGSALMMIDQNDSALVHHHLRASGPSTPGTTRRASLLWSNDQHFAFKVTASLIQVLADHRVYSSSQGESRWKIGDTILAYRDYKIQKYGLSVKLG